MILLFLGSWRSTLIVMVSIPLSILSSIAVLSALGQTINTMTLGGLALAVGILVDDSTVAIENTHRLFEEGLEFDEAVLEGAAGIALPTLVSTLAIWSVFSVFFLQGAARYLFTPARHGGRLRDARLLCHSRTLTPIIIRMLLRRNRRNTPPAVWLRRFHAGFNADSSASERPTPRARACDGEPLMVPLVAVCVVGGAAFLLSRKSARISSRRSMRA